MKLLGKGMPKKLSLFVLTLVALLCCVLGLSQFNKGNGGYNASATTIDFGEEGFTSGYEDELKELYEQLGGSSVSSYSELKSALDEKSGKKITAAELNTQNGEDLKITLGGLEWNVVYVSEAGSGDVIVTLWLAGSNDYSVWNKFAANNTTYKYPSSYYSTSYIRSVLNGTAYAADANVQTLTAGEQDAKWSSFLSVYGDYITTPSQVSWQEKEKKWNFYISGQDEGLSYNIPNEAYGKISGNWYTSELTDISSYLTNGDKFENSDYGAWANDKLWLPSLSETGYVQEATNEEKIGIWQTSVAQNANSLATEPEGTTYKNTWLRSGHFVDAKGACALSGLYTIYKGFEVTTNLAVRPAMHLNLHSVAMAVSGAAFEPTATAAAQGTGETNNGLSYTAEMQGAVKFNPAASNFLSADWKVGDTTKTATAATLGDNDWLSLDPDTGIISVKNAGTYTFWFTLKQDYAQWEGAEDGDNTPRSVTIIVQPKALKVAWNVADAYGDEDEGWYWNYDGQPHAFTAQLDRTQPGVDWDDLGTDNDVVSVRYREKSGASWSITAPNEAGVYTVSANLNGQNPNYVVEESEWEEFTIKKLNISIKWSGAGSLNDATDGLHWIYDGKTHLLTAAIEGLISDDMTGAVTVSVKYSKGTGIETADATLVPKDAGSYIAFAEISGDAAKNYNLVNREDESIEYAEQPFKITQRVISVNWIKNTVASDEYKNTYKWTYSGYPDRTDFSNTDTVTRYTFETEDESISGDTGVVGGLALNSNIAYATVTGGVVGTYDSEVRLNVGTYCVKVSITDKNYVLDNDVLEFSIEKRKVNVEWTGDGSLPTEDGTIAWRYDGKNHVPTANAILTSAEVASGGNLKDYIVVSGAEKEVTAIKGGSSYVATVAFKTDITGTNFNPDNYELVNASVNFEIIKGLITNVSWYETVDGEKKLIEETPSYIWGTVKGNGPGYSAVAKTKIYNASGDLVDISFNLAVSYPDANYAAGVEWAVNDVTGYKAVAKLNGPSTEGYNELSQRFEFLTDGEASSESYIVFLITRKAGEKDPVNIQWVVFVDNTTYYTLAQLEELGGKEIKINGGGYVFAKDGKFNFYYTGNPQAPSAIYVYDEPEDGKIYDDLTVSESSKKTNAGDWTAVLEASKEFAFATDDFECDYVIAPLNVKISWTNTAVSYNGNKRTPTANLDTTYISEQAQWYKDIIDTMLSGDGELAKITATGYIDAGDYNSEAQLGDNFAAVDGTEKTAFKINPFAVATSEVVWQWTDGAKNDTISPSTGKPTDPNAWYWVYDGLEHAPVPSLEATLDGTNYITLTLLVTGATKEVGEHYAFAWLDPNDDKNKNYMLCVDPLNPVTTLATQKFTIAKLEIDNVYWKGEAVDESWTGAYITVEGTDYKAVDLGTAEKPDLVLAFVYNGNSVCALPFYKDVAGSEVALLYEGAMKNVGNGPYTVRITNDFTFKDASGKAIPTVCRYVILSKQLELVWLDNEGNAIDENTSADKLVWEYNGLVQNPGVEELIGVDGNPLVEGTDYAISGWKDAGKYVSELTFINKNYSVKNTATQNYSIKPRVIEVEWTWEGIAEDEDGNVIPPVFSYDAAQPDISVSALAWAGGLEDAPATLADGKFEIEIAGYGKLVISLTYENLVDYVGKHTVKAVVGAVKLQDSETGNLIPQNIYNYIVGINGELEYEIEAYVIYVNWTGTGENNDVFEWTYDGINAFAPTATYKLWGDGDPVNAAVIGARSLAGDYVASVTLPENLRSNCVFAKLDENGELDWENGTSCGEHAFKVLKAEVEIEWKWTNGAKNDSAIDPETNLPNDPNAWYWVYDGTAHAPEAYIKGTDEQLEVTGAVTEAGENYVASASLSDAANYKFKNDDNQIIFTITVRLVWINWVDESDKANDEDFAWFFDGKEHAPKAVLANENGTDFLIDGKTVALIVSGSARNSGNYTATAEIASANYAFATDENLKRTQAFKIVQLVLDEDDFWWEPEHLTNVNFNGLKDGWYNYIFNGDVQYPIAVTEAGILFAYSFVTVEIDEDGNVKLDEDGNEILGSELAGISDAGTYKVTVTIVSTSDYLLPEGLESVYVNIAPLTVDVDWDTAHLYYNAQDQSPKAYYTDNFGNVNELEVTVEGAHALPDIEYTATASFIDASNVKNYVLGKHVEHTYKIEKRSIRIEWDDVVGFTFNNEGHYVKHTIYIDDAIPTDIVKLTVSYVIKDSKGNIVKIDGKNAQEVINAGEYVMVIQLDVLDENDAEILKYYTLADDTADAEHNFTIYRKELLVIADSFVGENAIAYGDEAPMFTAVFGKDVEGEIVGGLVDGEDLTKYDGITVLEDGKVTGAWLDSKYVEFAEPDMYEIIVLASLGTILTNYEIVAENGWLEVTAAPGTIIWHNDRNVKVDNPNFVYNGKEQKPDAYLFDGEKIVLPKLTVHYINENGEVITDKAINAGDYRVRAEVDSTVALAENAKQEIEYTIFPKEVVVNIDRFEITYGDRELSSIDGEDIFTGTELKMLWSYDGDNYPIGGDDLEIEFTWDVKDNIVNGFLQTGIYYIQGHYNGNPNYIVFFEGLNHDGADPDMAEYGIYVVNNADITDTSKRGTEWYFEERVIDKYETYFITIEDKNKDEDGNELDSYRYITFKGDQTAEVKFSYSHAYLVGRDIIPEPDDEEGNEFFPNDNNNHPGIKEIAGEWIINYRIEIDNHNTYYGRWRVLLKFEDEYIVVIFLKPYEIEYGTDVPENLTEVLVDEHYVQITIKDVNVLGGLTVEEFFKAHATAYVPLGYNKYVTNRTKVGAYTINFELDLEEDPVTGIKLDVIYKRSNADEASNIGMYKIVPRRLQILWGETQFTYDGNKHVPMPSISHWISEGSFILDNIANGKEYLVTDGGVTIKVIVYTEGNFVSSGGHKVTVTVDDPNYTILTADAVQTISIKGAFPWWLVYTLAAVGLASLIAFIIMASIMRKRKLIIMAGISDDEGFYDPMYVEEDETGLSDPYYAADYNDGFDYDQMWNDIYNPGNDDYMN